MMTLINKNITMESNIEKIEKIVFEVEGWEKTAIEWYREVKRIMNEIDSELKYIKTYLSSHLDNTVAADVEEYPEEYKDFSITYRKTYDFESNASYKEKKAGLKELEGLLKTAVDMDMKGKTLCWDDGMTIEPVPVKSSRVITCRLKK